MAEPFEEKRGVFHFGAAGRVIASRQRSKIPRSGAAKPLRVLTRFRGDCFGDSPLAMTGLTDTNCHLRPREAGL